MLPIVFEIVALALASPAYAADGTTPVGHDVSFTSLYRADTTWDVASSFNMTADDADGTTWKFSLVHPELLKDDPAGNTSRVTCVLDGKDQLDQDQHLLRMGCQYKPPTGFIGTETFQYVVKDSQGNVSHPATVTVTVKRGGLRWEVLTNGTTATSGDVAPNGIPDILGKSMQNVLFRLDWEMKSPSTPSAPAPDRKIGTNLTLTTNSHLMFETGFVSQPESVMASPAPTATTTSSTASSSTPASSTSTSSTTPKDNATPAVASKRKYTFGGEFDYNGVFAPSGGSTYFEVGAVLKGNVDTAVEGAVTGQDVGTNVVTLVRSQSVGAASMRGEIAMRAAIKQYVDDALRTAVTHDGKTTFDKNSDDFVVMEFGYRRDTAMAGLEALNITQNRYVLRVTATPEVPGVPGHFRPTIGLELTGGFGSGSPKTVQVIYGVNVGALGGLFQ